MTDAVQQAILALPAYAWTAAVQVDGKLRDGGDVAELTGILPAHGLDLQANGWPPGDAGSRPPRTPTPGRAADLQRHPRLPVPDLRHQHRCRAAALEARHRAHARVEDRIRCGKDTGYGRFPSRHFAINAVWPQLPLTAADLLAWTQTMLLDGDLAAAEPKTLRLHVAARITRGQRNIYIRIQQS